ncbi:hypothetical protein CH063_03926, partial [Colletotrichum higginsianum]
TLTGGRASPDGSGRFVCRQEHQEQKRWKQALLFLFLSPSFSPAPPLRLRQDTQDRRGVSACWRPPLARPALFPWLYFLGFHLKLKLGWRQTDSTRLLLNEAGWVVLHRPFCPLSFHHILRPITSLASILHHQSYASRVSPTPASCVTPKPKGQVPWALAAPFVFSSSHSLTGLLHVVHYHPLPPHHRRCSPSCLSLSVLILLPARISTRTKAPASKRETPEIAPTAVGLQIGHASVTTTSKTDGHEQPQQHALSALQFITLPTLVRGAVQLHTSPCRATPGSTSLKLRPCRPGP